MIEKIGLFDSGLGGLTVLRAVRIRMPHESYAYLGDTARTPYGTKGKQTVLRYSRESANFLLRHNSLKALVVACNTASSYALDELSQELSIPVIGTISEAAARAVATTGNGAVGVIGTEATISSAAYDRAVRALDPKIQIHSKSCPLFVPLVEQGMFAGEIVEKVVELYLAPLKSLGIDTLILGCTHFPLLKGVIEEYLGSGVEIIECSMAVAEEVEKVLQKGSQLNKSGYGQGACYVTDEVDRCRHLAGLLLQGEQVEVVRIHPLDEQREWEGAQMRARPSIG